MRERKLQYPRIDLSDEPMEKLRLGRLLPYHSEWECECCQQTEPPYSHSRGAQFCLLFVGWLGLSLPLVQSVHKSQSAASASARIMTFGINIAHNPLCVTLFSSCSFWVVLISYLSRFLNFFSSFFTDSDRIVIVWRRRRRAPPSSLNGAHVAVKLNIFYVPFTPFFLLKW